MSELSTSTALSSKGCLPEPVNWAKMFDAAELTVTEKATTSLIFAEGIAIAAILSELRNHYIDQISHFKYNAKLY